MTTVTKTFDVIVLGAGAAGLMCALTAGQRGRKVLLIDHADKVGAKILISGGGRCNFTNLQSKPDRFLSGNADFCRSALGRYTQADFIAMVERHGIPYHEKTLGQLFCNGSAREIVAMLLAECAQGSVDVRVGTTVTDISRADCFRVETSHGGFNAAALVLATGGLSIPKMGATGFAHDVARRFGLGVTELLPALVPLKATPEALGFELLAGVSLEAIVSCRGHSFREGILFTHRGLSGPAILQISSYWRQGDTISLDLAPEHDATAFLLERKRSRPKAEVKTLLAEIMPARLAQSLAETCLPSGQMANIPDRILAVFATRLKCWDVQPTDSEGWPKAEVTLGGIDTRHLSSKTMEAREVPGLYAIGEALDVTGWLGGYNFQWAWSSGWCAGQAIA
jgi:predicted Rossmann fold flavoprotein